MTTDTINEDVRDYIRQLNGEVDRLKGMVEILRRQRDEFIAEQLCLREQLGKANDRILQLQTGSERYWELRWRDEHAANEALRDTIEALTDEESK